jgi:hypothetical protein
MNKHLLRRLQPEIQHQRFLLFFDGLAGAEAAESQVGPLNQVIVLHLVQWNEDHVVAVT